MMESSDNVIPLRRTFQCASCGSDNGTFDRETIEFDYDRGNSAARLKANVTIEHCLDCGERLLGEDAEGNKHNAICRHLGVLTPAEITALRKSLRLSREELSHITGIGTASIARWELGKLIQNTAYDRLLRLLTVPGVRQKLEGVGRLSDDGKTKPKFKYLVADDNKQAQAANYEFN